MIAVPGYSTACKNHFKEDLLYNAVWNNDDKSQPDFKLTPLPNIQPECPMQVDEKAWNERVVIGNTDFHMFLVPKAGKKSFSIKGTGVYLPLAGEAVIMKVSRDRDLTNRWKYERMGSGSRQLFEQLKSFVKEVKDILKKSGFGKSKDYAK